jgi:hypothetical protein
VIGVSLALYRREYPQAALFAVMFVVLAVVVLRRRR